MSNRLEPQPGEFYKHFKDKLYQIITVSIHSETREKLVIYQALYGDYKTYARPLDMFLSEVDKEKYPEVTAFYRFEKVMIGDKKDGISNTKDTIEEKGTTKDEKKELIQKEIESIFSKEDVKISVQRAVVPMNVKEEDEVVNPLLLEYLDMKTYEDKLALVHYNKSKLTNELINAMSAAIDCTVEEGDIDSRINSFLFCLQTLNRFESKRLR